MIPGSRTDDFDYTLPEGRIARYPTEVRDQSRLMVVRRGSDQIEHSVFADLPRWMEPGDVLVVNDSRVRAARFLGRRASGAPAEVLLLRPFAGRKGHSEVEPSIGAMGVTPSGSVERWEALVHPGNKLKPGRVVTVADDLHIHIEEACPDGERIVSLRSTGSVAEARKRHGVVPLPHYMNRAAEAADAERYQTVYANEEGSVAAPTAGLHFTPELLAQIEKQGIQIVSVRLDVGVGTFRPVTTNDPADHPMHREWYEIPEDTVRVLDQVRKQRGKVWAVGTTVVRVLESAALTAVGDGGVSAGAGWTQLFIRPGFDFQVVDRLITNFHLPRSTLLMLVAAFAGYETAMASYAAALQQEYRFYSYGDAMVVL